MSKQKLIKLDKKDYMRAVLTDTAPSDVPIIFSNDGLYINHHKVMQDASAKFSVLKALYYRLVSPVDNPSLSDSDKNKDQAKQSFPMKYKIIKNESSLRTLSLIHPRSQKNYCLLYRDFADALTSHCDDRLYSIRSPRRVGGSFYSNKAGLYSKYKEVNIETLESDLRNKHASSFFSYYGYDRLYKFFRSSRYHSMEKKFPHMWMVDVANCFDTIYTHTISWAVKNKGYIRDNLSKGRQFCQDFDTVMQRSNNNETNGIPVGSEFSRLFSEMIFQDIDAGIRNSLSEKFSFSQGEEYDVARYVDDYVVFAINKAVAQKVYAEIQDNLAVYNLYLNEMKINKYERPFLTIKSEIALRVNEAVEHLESSIFSYREDGPRDNIYPKRIFQPKRLEISFVSKVKLMAGRKICYSEISPYITGVIYKRMLRLIQSYDRYSRVDKRCGEVSRNIRSVIFLLIRIMFFYYNVSPSVASSEKLSRAIVIADDFFLNNLSQYLASYRSLVMSCVEGLSFEVGENEGRERYVSLEKLNIIIATRNFGANYLLPHSKLMFGRSKSVANTYFEIVCLLYYCGDHHEYCDLRSSIIDAAVNKVSSSMPNLDQDAECVYIFLDLLSCPYVDRAIRRKMLREYFDCHERERVFNDTEIDEMVGQLSDVYWFVKWNGLDLMNALERKELKRPY